MEDVIIVFQSLVSIDVKSHVFFFGFTLKRTHQET